jgi:hypothetical protein
MGCEVSFKPEPLYPWENGHRGGQTVITLTLSIPLPVKLCEPLNWGSSVRQYFENTLISVLTFHNKYQAVMTTQDDDDDNYNDIEQVVPTPFSTSKSKD